MQNTGLISSIKLSMLLIGAAFFGIAVFVVTASIGSQQARATPVYAGQTGRQCGYCHVNPAGGGKLTTRGQRFQARGHKL